MEEEVGVGEKRRMELVEEVETAAGVGPHPETEAAGVDPRPLPPTAVIMCATHLIPGP